MLAFGTSFGSWFAATAVPAFVGLLLITLVGRRSKRASLAAFALGIFFWFFVDTIGGSANLGVSSGFAGGIDQAALVVLFILGVALFFAVSPDLFEQSSAMNSMSLNIPVLVAIAVGIHGFGEGTAFGLTAASTPSTSLLDAFGGTSAGIAYILHKGLEPMMIGACYIAYSKDRAARAGRYLADVLALTILFVIPSLIGAATGYYISYDATYFFALGTGTSIYAAMRLARPLFLHEEKYESRQSVKLGILLVLGFLCIYIAALFHS